MRRYIIGMLMGVALATTISAHAEVISLINKTVDGMFPVTIDGKPLGDAIVVDNKTYLPVREFGEAVGYKVTFTDTREVVMTKNVSQPNPSPSTTPAPAPTPPAMTKEQKIIQIQNRIEFFQTNITTDKMFVWDDEHSPNNSSESQKKKNKEILAKDEKELADLQVQLNALQSQP